MVPAGMHQRHTSASAVSTTYVYAYGAWGAPLAHLPVLTAPTVAVRFCPLLLRLRTEPLHMRGGLGAASSRAASAAQGPAVPDAALTPSEGDPALATAAAAAAAVCEDKSGAALDFVQLPYRMLFAVATVDSVVIYDTQVNWQDRKWLGRKYLGVWGDAARMELSPDKSAYSAGIPFVWWFYGAVHTPK